MRVKVLLFSPIRSAAAAGQQAVVVGGPGDGLHRGHVVAVGLHTRGKLYKVIYKVIQSYTKFQCKVYLHGRGLSAPRPGPHEQLVVVTPAGEVLEKYLDAKLKIFSCISCYLAVGGPLEAAHLLPVAHQSSLRSNTRGSDISLE